MNALRALVSVALLALLTTAPQADDKKPASKGIAPATVAAYEKLGADYGGWVKVKQDEDLPEVFVFKTGQKFAEQGLPGFRFHELPTGKLPDVKVPFGLDFNRIKEV